MKPTLCFRLLLHNDKRSPESTVATTQLCIATKSIGYISFILVSLPIFLKTWINQS